MLERGAEVVVAKGIYILGSNPSSALASFVICQKLLMFSVFWFFIDNYFIRLLWILDELISLPSSSFS